MANPKFLGVDLTVPTFSWSAGVNASYPLSNLKTYFPNQKSRSNSTASGQSFVWDMGSAVACNMLIIEGHNWAAMTADTIELQGDDNSGFTTPETIVAEVTAVSATAIILATFASKTYRYWRLVFTVAGTLGAAPEFGNIFLGTSLDFEKPQQWGFFTNVPFNPKTVDFRSLDNTGRTATVGKNIRKHLISFDDKNTQSDTFIASYLSFLATTYNGKVPFYYVDNTGTIYLVKFEKDFNPYETFLYNQNKILSLAMESVMADS